MKDKQKDEGDQELIKQQKAEQQKHEDGRVRPVTTEQDQHKPPKG